MYKNLHNQPSKSKKKHDISSCATYFSEIQKRNIEEITRTCVKQAPVKVFVTSAVQPKIRMNLFNKMPLSAGSDSNISSDSSPYARPLENILESPSVGNLPTSEDIRRPPFSEDNISNIPSRRPVRESLGILSDDCFTEVDNDFFLCNTNVDHFAASASSISSNLLNFTKPQNKASFKSSSTKPQLANKNNVYTNPCVSKDLSDLLHGNNREFLYELLCNVMRSTQIKLTQIEPIECVISRTKENRDDLTRLQYLHVQKELKIRKQKKIMKDLNVKIGREKSQVLAAVEDLDKLQYVQEYLDFNIKHVSLDASIKAIKEEIDFSQPSQSSDSDLKVLLESTMKVKNEIEIKLMEIKQMIEEIPKMEKELLSLKEKVLNQTWPIKMLQIDKKWVESLLENLNSQEIEIFKDYPLAYEKRCTFTNPQTYIRDLYNDDFLHGGKIEEEDFQMLSEILLNPFQPPELILLDLVKRKMKLDNLKRICNQSPSLVQQEYVTKYSYEDLQKQEGYLENAIDRLKSIMTSSESYKTLASGDIAKKSMEIYAQMPFKDYISSKRLVNEKGFKFYENKLNSFIVPHL